MQTSLRDRIVGAQQEELQDSRIAANQKLLSNLPPAETERTAARLVNMSLLPESMRVGALSAIVTETFERAKCYAETGKFPEEIKREKEPEELRRTLPWILVFVLSFLLAIMWLNYHGVTFGCDDPDPLGYAAVLAISVSFNFQCPWQSSGSARPIALSNRRMSLMACGVFVNRSANSGIMMITYAGESADHF